MADYYGEACHKPPPNVTEPGPGPYGRWPEVFGTFGHVDIAGYAKPAAWWYRVNWLAKAPIGSAGRPLVGGGSNASVRALTPCAGFASTPFAEMFVDGVPRGGSGPGGVVPVPPSGVVAAGRCTPPTPYRNLTLVGLDADGRTVLARHTVLAPARGGAARVELVVDVPSASTGTGSALYLDGQDVALVRGNQKRKKKAVEANETPRRCFSCMQVML